MKTSMFKRMLSTMLALVMILSCFAVSMVAYAESDNIKINGVDIGYAPGDYFSKDGKTCGNCHGRNTCGSASDCNCIEVDGAVQCKGYAYYCQKKVYNCSESSAPDKYTKDDTDYTGSNCSGTKIKGALNGCKPATHVRTQWGHSIVIISTNDTTVEFTDVNWGHTCIVREESMSWDEFATWLKNYNGGIDYIMQSNATTSSNPFLLIFQNFFKTLIPMFSMPGIGPILRAMFKGLFS